MDMAAATVVATDVEEVADMADTEEVGMVAEEADMVTEEEAMGTEVGAEEATGEADTATEVEAMEEAAEEGMEAVIIRKGKNNKILSDH